MSKRERAARVVKEAARDPRGAGWPPDGFIAFTDADGRTERMGYWLPAGITPADIGLGGTER